MKYYYEYDVLNKDGGVVFTEFTREDARHMKNWTNDVKPSLSPYKIKQRKYQLVEEKIVR